MSRRRVRLTATCVMAAGLAVATFMAAPAASLASTASTASSLASTRPTTAPAGIVRNPFLAGRGTLRVCGVAGVVAPRCLAEVLTVRPGSDVVLSTATPKGYGPAVLAEAYSLPKDAVGEHGIIAVLDEGADPKLESDLNVYRSTFGLPPCTTANKCFAQYDEHGGAAIGPGTQPIERVFDEGSALETSLDVDMASAACPMCRIIEITVDRDIFASDNRAASDFGPAVDTAARLGANAVSISYQFPPDDTLNLGAVAGDFFHPGIAITVASGDAGYEGTPDGWPQDLQTVTSVGGTSLYVTGKGTFEEVGWSGGGSGCSDVLGPAVGQPASVAAACKGFRASTDVSADADPTTGVAVYDSYAPATHQPLGWVVVGGTSLGAPYIAGLYARGGNLAKVVGPNTLYGAPARDFNDITAGSNAVPGGCDPYYLCTARRGWDGPTGLGSPHGLGAF